MDVCVCVGVCCARRGERGGTCQELPHTLAQTGAFLPPLPVRRQLHPQTPTHRTSVNKRVAHAPKNVPMALVTAAAPYATSLRNERKRK